MLKAYFNIFRSIDNIILQVALSISPSSPQPLPDNIMIITFHICTHTTPPIRPHQHNTHVYIWSNTIIYVGAKMQIPSLAQITPEKQTAKQVITFFQHMKILFSTTTGL